MIVRVIIWMDIQNMSAAEELAYQLSMLDLIKDPKIQDITVEPAKE